MLDSTDGPSKSKTQSFTNLRCITIYFWSKVDYRDWQNSRTLSRLAVVCGAGGLSQIVEALLKDGTVAVVASAAFVFGAVCPGELRLLAPRFRALCRMLPDMEEWGQAVLADLLLRHTIGRHGAAGRG
eukprot:SM008787S23795  [mRNA]  locus=s8787:223:603:+ [translate_table: standard]